jgi:hypothetical protein
MSEAELHFIRARLQGGSSTGCHRELPLPLAVGLVRDRSKNVVRHADSAVQQVLTHLFLTFERTGRSCRTSTARGCSSRP